MSPRRPVVDHGVAGVSAAACFRVPAVRSTDSQYRRPDSEAAEALGDSAGPQAVAQSLARSQVGRWGRRSRPRPAAPQSEHLRLAVLGAGRAGAEWSL